MEFLGWFLPLSVAALLLQTCVVSASLSRYLKTKEKYFLKKAERYCLLPALIIPPLVFFVYYLAFHSGEEPLITALWRAATNALVNTWGLFLPTPILSIYALIISETKKHKPRNQS